MVQRFQTKYLNDVTLLNPYIKLKKPAVVLKPIVKPIVKPAVTPYVLPTIKPHIGPNAIRNYLIMMGLKFHLQY
jgi:hypothetical protein